MANRFVSPFEQMFDATTADFLSGGMLHFYVTGTSTPTDTFSEQTLDPLLVNANPVVLNSAGRHGPIFLDPAVTYRVVLTDANNVPIATADPVVDFAANISTAFAVFAGNPNGSVAGSAGTVGGSGASVVWDITNQLLYVCITSGTASTAVWKQIGGDLPGQLTQTGVISPAQLVANTDDWTPTGIETASVVRLSADAARDLTGIAAQPEGTLLTLVNIGTLFTLTLKNENAGSSAVNRLALPQEVSLRPNAAVTLRYDATSSRWRPQSQMGTAYPPRFIVATIANNSGDATNDIDIPACQMRDITNSVNIDGTAMTKRLDANWAAGTNQGFRNSAAAIANATYSIYAVTKALGAAPEYYAHTSAVTATVLTALQAETGGADYLYARRIGSIVRAGGVIKPFVQLNDEFLWVTAVGDTNTTDPGSAAVTASLTVPVGPRVNALFSLEGRAGGAVDFFVLVTALDQTDSTPSTTIHDFFCENSTSQSASSRFNVRTNTLGQVRHRFSNSDASTVVAITTYGYLDYRERFG